MATRHADIELSLAREAQRDRKARNPLARAPLEAVPTRYSNVDPSPFSRVRPAEADLSRHERISRAAYRRAEQRGFTPGHDLDDWLAAEREVDSAHF